MNPCVTLSLLPIKHLETGPNKWQLAPLGLLYLNCYLKKDGVSTILFNFGWQEISLEEAAIQIAAYSPLIHGISASTGYSRAVKEFARLIKKYSPNTKIVVGGYVCLELEKLLATDSPIDYVVIGEGEITFPALVREIAVGNDNPLIPGIGYSRAGKIVKTGKGSVIKDVSYLPYLDLSDNPPHLYGDRFGFELQTGRGCLWNRCTFCTLFNMSSGYRKMQLDRIVDEIIYQCDRYPSVGHIFFTDDYLSLRRLYNIHRTLVKRDIRSLKYSFQTSSKDIIICRSLLEDHEFTSHLYSIGYGAESFCDDQLREYNKGVTAKENLEAFKLLQSSVASRFTIYMLVDDSLERISESCHLLAKNGAWPYVHSFNPVMRVGTRLNIDRNISFESGQPGNKSADRNPDLYEKTQFMNMTPMERCLLSFNDKGIWPWQNYFGNLIHILLNNTGFIELFRSIENSVTIGDIFKQEMLNHINLKFEILSNEAIQLTKPLFNGIVQYDSVEAINNINTFSKLIQKEYVILHEYILERFDINSVSTVTIQ